MNEKVGSGIWRDPAIAFLIVKRLHGSVLSEHGIRYLRMGIRLLGVDEIVKVTGRKIMLHLGWQGPLLSTADRLVLDRIRVPSLSSGRLTAWS